MNTDSRGNRLAEGAKLLQHGNSPEDHAHVSRITPQQTKKKEIENDPQYQSEAMDRAREKSTAAARRGGNVRPLDGSGPKV